MSTPQVDWTGVWVNEYGSRLEITDDAGGRIDGFFATALGDSTFADQAVAIQGLCQGSCLHFAFATKGRQPAVASFTGQLRDGLLHMAWHVVSDRAVKAPRPGAEPVEIELPWAHAVLANSDTFRRQE